MRICLQTRIHPRPYLFVSFHVPVAAALSALYTALKQCTALNVGSNLAACAQDSRHCILLSIVYCGDCQQTFSCLPTVFSLILIRTKPNKPDRQTCHKWKCWSFHLWSPDSRNPPSRIAWSQSDVDEVAKEVINDLDKVKDVLEDKNNFVIEQKKIRSERKI